MIVRGQLGIGVHVLMSKWSERVRNGGESELVSDRFLEGFGCAEGGSIVRGGSTVRATCNDLWLCRFWSNDFGRSCVASSVSCVGTTVDGCGVGVVAELTGFANVAMISSSAGVGFFAVKTSAFGQCSAQPRATR